MTARTRLLVLLVTAPVVGFAVIGGFLGKAMAREGTYQHLRVFEDVVSLIMSNYVENVDVDRVMTGAMRGLAEGLDPESAYLTPAEVRSLEKGDKLPAGDTGLDLTRQYYLRVIAARPGSPADRAGLRPGDFIRAIDNKPTREMSVFEGMRLLRGAPGSKVTVTVIRGNAAEPHVVEIERTVLPAAEVTGKLLPDGVGYLRVPEFGPTTPAQIGTRVAELMRGGATRLAIDVRDAARGDLETGIAAARLFVPSGTLAFRQSRTTPKEPIEAAAGDGRVTAPTVVLVDEGTSGASELFAAALAGNKRAQIVGEHTRGRATVQKLVTLPDNSGLWLSTTWYLVPAGSPLEEKGLTPDVEVDEPDLEFGAAPPANDAILEKAVTVLKTPAADKH